MDIKANLRDPRYYQIAVLGALVAYGGLPLAFGIRIENAIAIAVTALLVQFAGTKAAGLPRFDPLSPLITSLSLTLLLRTDLIGVATLAALIAISSKFLVRMRGKHVFNPANVALVSMMLISDQAWVSSGQWGSAAIGAFALSCLGFLVLTRAKRAETTIAFLLFFGALLFGRFAIDALGNMRRLLADGVQHGTGVPVEAHTRIRVTDSDDRAAHDFLEINPGGRGDFAGDDRHASLYQRFARNSCVWILLENLAEEFRSAR